MMKLTLQTTRERVLSAFSGEGSIPSLNTRVQADCKSWGIEIQGTVSHEPLAHS